MLRRNVLSGSIADGDGDDGGSWRDCDWDREDGVHSPQSSGRGCNGGLCWRFVGGSGDGDGLGCSGRAFRRLVDGCCCELFILVTDVDWQGQYQGQGVMSEDMYARVATCSNASVDM